MPSQQPDPERIALGIRQPWAELILRGLKTVEIRTLDTTVRGTIYLYASKRLCASEAARIAAEAEGLDLDALPRGRLVGSVELFATAPARPADAAAACVPAEALANRYGWHLRNPVRLPEPLTVRFLPYGVWFYPFRRRNAAR